MRTIHIMVTKVVTEQEIKELLLVSLKGNKDYCTTLANMIVNAMNGVELEELYKHLAGIAEPTKVAEVVKNVVKHPTVTWKLKYPLQSINEESILAQIGEMEHGQLIVEDGRLFMKVVRTITESYPDKEGKLASVNIDRVVSVEMVEQFTISEYTKDYKGHLIKCSDKYSKYMVNID